ncbi:MAG: hypothetical protein ACR2N3_05635 [Pyrinomonadaceae bacterium]
MKNIPIFLVLLLCVFGCRLFNRGNSATSGSSPSYPASDANTKQFVNSRDNLTGNLANNYVDFSFNYPSSWTLDPTAGKPGASNFAKVEKTNSDNYTMENFAVGYFSSSGSAEGDKLLFPKLADQLSSQFAKGFPNYAKLSEGATRVGSYDGYEFRLTATVTDAKGKSLPLWGRVVMIPNTAGKRNGVVIIMLATPLAPGVTSVDDVGVKGELPVILNSFRLN